jgi:hypothetical protein
MLGRLSPDGGPPEAVLLLPKPKPIQGFVATAMVLGVSREIYLASLPTGSPRKTA